MQRPTFLFCNLPPFLASLPAPPSLVLPAGGSLPGVEGLLTCDPEKAEESGKQMAWADWQGASGPTLLTPWVPSRLPGEEGILRQPLWLLTGIIGNGARNDVMPLQNTG